MVAGPVGFVAKIGTAGQLLYSTLMGHDNTVVNSVALDPAANVYIAGSTGSVSFPATVSAPQRTLGGATDGFVAKLNLNNPALVYATLVGGSGVDSLAGIAVTSAGAACVAGATNSGGLLTYHALQPAYGGSEDALVGCLNPSGSAWSFLTYWGGTAPDLASGITLDAGGDLLIAGATMSPNFPVTTSATAPRDYDAFITKLRADGSQVMFSTLLGGSGSDAATSVVTDAAGFVWFGGYTSSIDFPQLLAIQNALGGGVDGFVAELTPDGGTLLLSTCVGGAGDDRVLTMALKQSGMIAAAGMTNSANFPTTTLPLQGRSAGSYDGFLTLISNRSQIESPGTFSNGTWELDLNANRTWDGPVTDRLMSLGQVGDIPLVGDWNGDGRAKAGIFRNGLWVLDYNGDGIWEGPPTDRFFYLGQAGDIPVAGDWNGDGRTKAGIFRNGLWILDYNGDGIWEGPPTDRFFYLGQAGDVPVVGDWNGDGRTKAGIFRNGLWILDYNGDGIWEGPPTDRFFYLGQAGDVPVVGDWNGDGRTKAGIFRAGLWILDYNGDGIWEGPPTDRFFYLGQPGGTPVVGDWNGDGRSKAASFWNGAWIFDLSGTGTAVSGTFGSTNGAPLSGRWQ